MEELNIRVSKRIVNVVATSSIPCQLDFHLLKRFRNISYDPSLYGGRAAYFKSSDMEGRISIFASGKIVSVGTKSEEKAAQEIKRFGKFLFKKHITKSVNMKTIIRNIVVIADFGKALDFEDLVEKKMMVYEPEQFPGGILRIKQPCKATILIFSSGKAAIMGLKSSELIDPVIKEISRIIAM